MATQLQQQFEERGLLMAALSHGLRTPLTRLRMRLETLDLPADQRERAIAGLRAMNQLIDQSLSLLRQQAEPEAAQPVDLAALLQARVRLPARPG